MGGWQRLSAAILATVLTFGFAADAMAQVRAVLPGGGETDQRTRNLAERVTDLMRDREYDLASKLIEEALEMDPQNSQARNLLGAVRTYQKRYDEAASIYNNLLEETPESMSLEWNLAEVDFLQKRYKEARERLEKLRERAPQDEMLTYKIALTHLFAGQEKEAREEIEKIPFPSNTAGYYYGRAALDLVSGRREEGLEWVAESARIFPANHNTIFGDPLVEKNLLTAEDIIRPAALAAPMPTPEEGIEPSEGLGLTPSALGE